jgi:hypothetical protein
MAFGTQDEPDEVMNEINMTPLVDVMLVLLIIFIITMPVMKHAVNIDLPRATSQPQDAQAREHPPERGRQGRLLLEREPHRGSELCQCSRPKPPRNRSPSCTSAATRKCATNAWPGHVGSAAGGRAQDRLSSPNRRRTDLNSKRVKKINLRD